MAAYMPLCQLTLIGRLAMIPARRLAIGRSGGFVIRISRLILAATATLVVIAGSPVPAQAHDSCVEDSAGDVACSRNGHFTIDACDRASDGNRVRGWYQLNGVADPWPTPWDPNGANSGCAHDGGWWTNFYRHRVCAEVIGCSVWRSH
jgi:hypothetical protein